MAMIEYLKITQDYERQIADLESAPLNNLIFNYGTKQFLNRHKNQVIFV